MTQFKFNAKDRAATINWVLDAVKQKLESKHGIKVREIGDYEDAHQFAHYMEILTDLRKPIKYCGYGADNFNERKRCKGFINKATAELAKEYERVKEEQANTPDSYQQVAQDFVTGKIDGKQKDARMKALDAVMNEAEDKEATWEMIAKDAPVTDEQIMDGVEELASKAFKINKPKTKSKIINGAADEYYDPDGNLKTKKKFWEFWK